MTRSLCVMLVWVLAGVVLSGCAQLSGSVMSLSPDANEVPIEDLRAVADEIEAAVARGDREANIQNREGLIVETSEIQQAIRTRAARASLLGTFMDSGHVWERKNGLVSILRTKEYKQFGNSRDRDRYALMVMGENNNRWELYEGLVDANHWSAKALSTVQRVFYEARLQHMAPGWRYETLDGDVAAGKL